MSLLEMYIWDSFAPDYANDKVKYWVDHWTFSIDRHINGGEGLEMLTPHTVLIELLEEASLNRFINPENKNILTKRLSNFIINDQVVKKHYSNQLQLLITSSNDDLFYFIKLCEKLIGQMSGGTFLGNIVDRLIEVLNSERDLTAEEEEIRYLSNCIIVELMLRGYSLESIQSIPRKMYSIPEYHNYLGRHEWDYPHNIEFSSFGEDENFDSDAYSRALVAKADTLSAIDRLDYLKHIYNLEDVEGIYQIKIDGIKGTVDLKIGDVKFLSADSPELLKHDLFHIKKSDLDELPDKMAVDDSEPIGDRESQDTETSAQLGETVDANSLIDDAEQKLLIPSYPDFGKYVYAAVPVKYVDMKVGIGKAIDKIETAIDIMRLYTTHSDSINVEKAYEVYTISGELAGSGHTTSRDNPNIRLLHALSTDAVSKFDSISMFASEEVDKIVNNAPSQTSKQIREALRWKGKAVSADRLEDKITHNWITLEKLFNFDYSALLSAAVTAGKKSKEDLIVRYLPYLLAKRYFSGILVDLHSDLGQWYNSSHGYKKILSLDLNVARSLLLVQGESSMSSKEFLDNLRSSLPAYERKVIKDRVERVVKFFDDPKFAKKEIEGYVTRMENHIRMIYRARNQIVHNAKVDSNMIDHLTKIADLLTGRALQSVLLFHVDEPKKSLEEYYSELQIDIKLLSEDLNRGLPINLSDKRLFSV